VSDILFCSCGWWCRFPRPDKIRSWRIMYFVEICFGIASLPCNLMQTLWFCHPGALLNNWTPHFRFNSILFMGRASNLSWYFAVLRSPPWPPPPPKWLMLCTPFSTNSFGKFFSLLVVSMQISKLFCLTSSLQSENSPPRNPCLFVLERWCRHVTWLRALYLVVIH
jgi:hypothetical protein